MNVVGVTGSNQNIFSEKTLPSAEKLERSTHTRKWKAIKAGDLSLSQINTINHLLSLSKELNEKFKKLSGTAIGDREFNPNPLHLQLKQLNKTLLKVVSDKENIENFSKIVSAYEAQLKTMRAIPGIMNITEGDKVLKEVEKLIVQYLSQQKVLEAYNKPKPIVHLREKFDRGNRSKEKPVSLEEHSLFKLENRHPKRRHEAAETGEIGSFWGDCN